MFLATGVLFLLPPGLVILSQYNVQTKNLCDIIYHTMIMYVIVCILFSLFLLYHIDYKDNGHINLDRHLTN